MDIKTLVREGVMDLPVYSVGKTPSQYMEEYHLPRLVRMNGNENPLGPSPLAQQAMAAAIAEVNFYPEGSSQLLREAIAKRFDLMPEMVFCANGGDNIITCIMRSFLNQDDEMIIGSPSFVIYEIQAQSMRVNLIKVPLNQEMAFDLPKIAAAITDKTKLIVVVNPNNPTGAVVDPQQMADFIEQLPPHCLLLLDEAYVDFADRELVFDVLPQIRNGKNIISLRTFSKFYGLAGLRVGYALAPQPVLNVVRRVIEAYPVNILAQAAAAAALDDKEFIVRSLAAAQQARKYFTDELRKLGCRVTDSQSNFLFADFGCDGKYMAEQLLRRGYWVRFDPAWGYDNSLRFSFASEQDNKGFVQAVAEILGAER